MSDRPLRFGMSGTQWGPNGIDPRTYLRNEASRAEQAGFDVFTFADHTVPGMRPALTKILCAADSFDTMATVIAHTRTDLLEPETAPYAVTGSTR